MLGVVLLATALSILAGSTFRDVSAIFESFWEGFRITDLSHLRDTISWAYEEHAFVTATGGQILLLATADFIENAPLLNMLIPTAPLTLPVALGHLALMLAAANFVLGILGLLYANKSGKKSWILVCLAFFGFVGQLILLILLFSNDGLVWPLIFAYLAIPIIYFVGAAQNTGNRTLSENAVAYSFILPNLIGFSIFVLVPMLFALGLSFMDWNLANNTFTFVYFMYIGQRYG